MTVRITSTCNIFMNAAVCVKRLLSCLNSLCYLDHIYCLPSVIVWVRVVFRKTVVGD